MLLPNLDYGENLVASQRQSWEKTNPQHFQCPNSGGKASAATDPDSAPCCYLILYRKKEFSFKILDIGCKLVQAECGWITFISKIPRQMFPI